MTIYSMPCYFSIRKIAQIFDVDSYDHNNVILHSPLTCLCRWHSTKGHSISLMAIAPEQVVGGKSCEIK